MLLSNILKITSDVAADHLGPRTLAEKLRNNDNVIYLKYPNWKSSSMK